MAHQPSSPLEPGPQTPETASRLGTLFVPDTVSDIDPTKPGPDASMAEPLPTRVAVNIVGDMMG